MRIVLLVPLLWVVFFSSAHAEIDLGAPKEPVDAMSTEAAGIIPPARRWYVGGAIGLSYLRGWDSGAIDGYYQSLGYRRDYEASGTFEYSLMKTGVELSIYAGYRVNEFLDAELGFFDTVNDWYYRWVYEDPDNINPKQQMSQSISAHAVSLSALLRPFDHGYQQGLYLKFGRHLSVLSSATTNNGSLIDTTAAGVGGIPRNGTTTGRGNLLGLGFDIKLPKRGGAVRVEFNRYYNLGGTSFDKIAFNLGYNTGF